MSNDVLPPWSPIVSSRSGDILSMSLWGRRYEFGQFPFPFQIESAGSSLLASPVRLSAKVGTELVKWDEGSIEVTEQTPAKVTILHAAVSPSIRLSASISVEYDGLIRIDCRLEPRHAVRLESLALDIPLRKEHARLYYYCPRRDRVGPGTGGGTGGSIPADGFATEFSPYFWLGSEERGLAWFTESSEHWTNDRAGNAIEIIRSQNEVVLRIRLITDPVWLAATGDESSVLSYTFGLQATPVRPIEKDAWDTRIYHVNQELPELLDVRLKIPDELLDDMAGSGVRTICIHEHWTDIEAYFTTEYGEDLKRLVSNCHERGMQVLLYFGFLISDLAPQWPTMGAECVVHPDDKGCYVPYNVPPQPIQNAYTVCYNSRWKDVMIDGVADVIRRYGIDGLYLDGTTIPWGCRNPAHGCGYRRPDGTLGFTYPIFAVRELMKALYALVMRNNPDGQINIHASHYLTIPTIAWTTGYTDGEQFAWDEVEQKIVADGAMQGSASGQGAGIPLDRFRCEFMGHHLGVPADFLADIRGPFKSCFAAASFALLHDVPIRIWMRYEFTFQRQLWNLRDRFGCQEAEWLPYWRNSAFVTVEGEGVYCSLHCHPTNGVLAVVSNLGRNPVTATVQLKLNELGMTGDIAAQDAFTGEAVHIDEQRFTLSLESLGWRIIWARPKLSPQAMPGKHNAL